MRLEETTITPAIARKLLEINHPKNRGMSAERVRFFELMLRSGHQLLTHQSIGVSDEGLLIDGQHRLQAIANMPDGFGIVQAITYDVPAAAFGVLDQGMKRSMADVTSIDNRTIAVATSIIRIYTGSKTMCQSTFVIKQVSAAIQLEFDALMKATPSPRKHLSSSSVRAAAVIQMRKPENTEYVTRSYAALIFQTYDEMTPVIQSFNRQVYSDSRMALHPTALLMRAFRAFDSDNALTPKLHIRDEAAELERIRDAVDNIVGGLPSIEGFKRAKTSARKRANWRTLLLPDDYAEGARAP